MIVDAPATWTSAAAAATAVDSFIVRDSHAALYFPRLLIPDPLAPDSLYPSAPCGAIAGLYARTDAALGVWKAPVADTLQAVSGLTVAISDTESRTLNPLAINTLRSFSAGGTVVWGARTLAGVNTLASEWKYVSVRRTALYLEESLYRGLRWAVFEPNAEPLWSQIRLSIGAFMHNLFRQGAFQGCSPREAYFVKCNHETTTQNDIDMGCVNIWVGFAPLRPAEFIILRIRLLAA